MWACLLQNMFASSSGQLGKRLNAWVSSTVLYLTSIIYAAAALINFFGCLWYWVARREGLTNSWLTDVGELLLLLLPPLLLPLLFSVPATRMRRNVRVAAANAVIIAMHCCQAQRYAYLILGEDASWIQEKNEQCACVSSQRMKH